jgi:hypothetical protein
METPANDRQSSRNNQNNRYKFIICILEKVHTSSLYLGSCTTLWLPSGPRSCWKSIALHRRRTAAAASRSQNGRAAGTVGIAPGGARGGSRGGEGPAARWPAEETARRRRQALARGPRWNFPVAPGPGAGVGVLLEPSGREAAATLQRLVRSHWGRLVRSSAWMAARCTRRARAQGGAAPPRSRGGPGRFGRAWLDSDAVVLARGGYAGRVLSSVPALPTGPRDASAQARSTSARPRPRLPVLGAAAAAAA